MKDDDDNEDDDVRGLLDGRFEDWGQPDYYTSAIFLAL